MFTTNATHITALLGVTFQSTFRWFSRHGGGYPEHVSRGNGAGGSARHYRLSDVVSRLRRARSRGLCGRDLALLVEHDAEARRMASHEDLYIGDRTAQRSDDLIKVLTSEEESRLRSARSSFANAAVAAGVKGIARLRHALILHPGVLRFVLTGSTSEMPVGDLGWFSFSRAFCVINIEEELEYT